MKIRFLCLLLFLCTQVNAALIDSTKSFSGISISKYNKLEIGVHLNVNLSLINPYDSAAVNMYAIFTAPDGKKYRRNAFWYVPYSRCNTCVNSIERTDDDSCDGWNDVQERMSPTDPEAYLVAIQSTQIYS